MFKLLFRLLAEGATWRAGVKETELGNGSVVTPGSLPQGGTSEFSSQELGRYRAKLRVFKQTLPPGVRPTEAKNCFPSCSPREKLVIGDEAGECLAAKPNTQSP